AGADRRALPLLLSWADRLLAAVADRVDRVPAGVDALGAGEQIRPSRNNGTASGGMGSRTDGTR
ncbi:MAG: hypothetical protein ACRDNT_27950, partial [Streptosporangiaceae bacterium]